MKKQIIITVTTLFSVLCSYAQEDKLRDVLRIYYLDKQQVYEEIVKSTQTKDTLISENFLGDKISDLVFIKSNDRIIVTSFYYSGDLFFLKKNKGEYSVITSLEEMIYDKKYNNSLGPYITKYINFHNRDFIYVNWADEDIFTPIIYELIINEGKYSIKELFSLDKDKKMDDIEVVDGFVNGKRMLWGFIDVYSGDITDPTIIIKNNKLKIKIPYQSDSWSEIRKDIVVEYKDGHFEIVK